MEGESSTLERNQINWNKDIEYWLVSLGTAVGFGCIWRFPYIMYENGGATFLIPFTLALYSFVFPQMYLEIALGQFFK